MPTNINSKVLLRCLSQIQASSYCEIIAVVGRPASWPACPHMNLMRLVAQAMMDQMIWDCQLGPSVATNSEF